MTKCRFCSKPRTLWPEDRQHIKYAYCSKKCQSNGTHRNYLNKLYEKMKAFYSSKRKREQVDNVEDNPDSPKT